MSSSLREVVASVDWPEPYLAATFAEDVDLMWGTEEGRALVLRFVEVIGQPSQFLPGKMWLVKDLLTHFNALDAFNAQFAEPEAPIPEEQIELEEPVAEKPVKEKRPVGRPRIFPEEHRVRKTTLAMEWHDAIAQRKAALAESKRRMDATARELQLAHDVLKDDWDAYVKSKRDAWKSVQNAAN